jgi:hypothetical protein
MKSAILLSSILGGSASASRRAATAFLNQLVHPGVLILLACLCLSAHAQTGEWTWMGGSNTVYQPGVYGTLGTPAAGNIPGSRTQAVSWTDSSGNFWLFGGEGLDANRTMGQLNDLWEFNPSTNQWSWMGGSNARGQLGVYGSFGAAGNIPGCRRGATSWTDHNGNFWLFGGIGIDANGNGGFLNDLWEFNPNMNVWMWMGGSNTINQTGEYPPTMGFDPSSPVSYPGSRMSAISWTDSSNRLWLIGGTGYGANGSFGVLSDVWMFLPGVNQWMWMGGSSTPNAQAVYPNMGNPPPYSPGDVEGASSWSDGNTLLLFGGNGNGSNLWMLIPTDTAQWGWMGGSGDGNSQGVYGTLGTPAAGNIPDGRQGASSWTDSSGNDWLFGGGGNDLWEFYPQMNQWAWMGGGRVGIRPGVYGTLGTGAAGNIPGGHQGALSWTDSSGNFWLFGGNGIDANGNGGMLNDLWRYQTLPTAATPTFSVADGTYTSAQTVSIADTTPDTVIYYTLDGSTPTTGSTVYSGPIAVSSSETINAIAMATGYTASAMASASYVINLPATAAAVFTPAAGTYTAVQKVKITDPMKGASIYYTLDGSTPTTASARYTGAISVNQTSTINAIAVATGYSSSAVASATYTLNLPPAAVPVFTPTAGAYTSIQKVKLADATTGASIYYTLDGSTPTTSSVKYTGAITVVENTTVNAIAVATGYSSSSVASAIYIITLPAAAPTFTPAAGAYGQAQLVTLASAAPNPTIYYTTDGSMPTESSAQYTGPVAVDTTETIKAIAAATGYTDSPVASAKFTLVSSPRVLTGLASDIATPAATLNATVHDFDSAGQVWFLWGTNSTALNSSTEKVTLPALSGVQSVSAPLIGLAGGTNYYFQPVAATVGGTTYGAIQSFTTN